MFPSPGVRSLIPHCVNLDLHQWDHWSKRAWTCGGRSRLGLNLSSATTATSLIHPPHHLPVPSHLVLPHFISCMGLIAVEGVSGLSPHWPPHLLLVAAKLRTLAYHSCNCQTSSYTTGNGGAFQWRKWKLALGHHVGPRNNVRDATWPGKSVPSCSCAFNCSFMGRNPQEKPFTT